MTAETPRTDAAEAAYETYATLSDGKVMIDVAVPFAPGGFDFARSLERDLTAARDALKVEQSRVDNLQRILQEQISTADRTLDAARSRVVEIDAENGALKAKLVESRARVAELEAGLRTSLESVQNTLEAAYHNCYESCCGRAGYECCGNTVPTWTTEDQRTMDVLGPVERSLRALLSPSPEPTK